MSFSFDIHHLPNVSVVTLRGKIMNELDLESISLEVKQMIDKNKCRLIFDSQELTYINSSGINLFMRTLTKARTNNGDLIFCGINGNVENLFKITKLNEIYTIYATQKEAISHFKNQE